MNKGLLLGAAVAMMIGLGCSRAGVDTDESNLTAIEEGVEVFVGDVEPLAEFEDLNTAPPVLACWEKISVSCTQAGANYLCKCKHHCVDWTDAACTTGAKMYTDRMTCALNAYNTASACFGPAAGDCRTWCAAQAACKTTACLAGKTCVNDGAVNFKYDCK